MNKTRRSVLTLSSFTLASFFTGCFSSLDLTKEKKSVSKDYLLYPEKHLKEIEETIKKHTYEKSVLDYIALQRKKNLQIAETAHYLTKEEKKYPIDLIFGFPWYFGPNPALSKEDFLVRKFGAEDLLFLHFGFGDRMELFYINSFLGKPISNSDIKNIFNFNSLEELYLFLFYRFANYSSEELLVYLELISDKNNVSLNNFFKMENLKKFNIDFLKVFYNRYIKYSFEDLNKTKMSEINEKDLNHLMENWFFTLDYKRYYFQTNNYIVYTSVLFLIKELIIQSKNKKISLSF